MQLHVAHRRRTIFNRTASGIKPDHPRYLLLHADSFCFRHSRAGCCANRAIKFSFPSSMHRRLRRGLADTDFSGTKIQVDDQRLFAHYPRGFFDPDDIDKKRGFVRALASSIFPSDFFLSFFRFLL